MTLRVAVRLPVSPGSGAGGVEQFLLGLTRGLASAPDDKMEYVLVLEDHTDEWIDPHVSESMEVVTRHSPPTKVEILLDKGTDWIRDSLAPVLQRQSLLDDLRPSPSVTDTETDYTALGADIVHFPTPPYRRTELPCLFNPHDLLHRHYPEYFSERNYRRRELQYGAGCREADAVDVPSEFVKDDVVSSYGVDEEKVFVVQRGPPTKLYDSVSDSTLAEVSHEYELPDSFGLYPAKAMPHKNHRRLFQALAESQRVDQTARIVCTGRLSSTEWERLQAAIEEFGVEDQVFHLGFVPEDHLRALYRLSEFVFLPSLFEGDGLPLQEAWAESTPIACSETTALGEKAGDAALTFDPNSVTEMVDVLRSLQTGEEMRQELVSNGRERLSEFSWRRTGRTYRALYRQVGGVDLTEDDRAILSGP